MRLRLQNLYTGYFALVMGTEIVSIAMLLYGHRVLSDLLWWIGLCGYLALWLAYGARLLMWPHRVWADLSNPGTAFGFFTIVAASNVLAVRFLFGHEVLWAIILGCIGLSCWAVLFYAILTILILGPAIRLSAVNGGWLIAIVAEESIATLAAAMITAIPSWANGLFLVGLTFWAMGVMLYVVFIGLIMDRLLFQRVMANDLQPPYWINMGATAITVLASSRLLLISPPVPILITVRPFLEGITIVLWAWGTWWIPLLIILGLWKYIRDREPVAYHPSQWSIVFPLGMYATATTTMARIHGFELLHSVGALFIWVGFGAWTLVAGLALRQMSTTRHRSGVGENNS